MFLLCHVDGWAFFIESILNSGCNKMWNKSTGMNTLWRHAFHFFSTSTVMIQFQIKSDFVNDAIFSFRLCSPVNSIFWIHTTGTTQWKWPSSAWGRKYASTMWIVWENQSSKHTFPHAVKVLNIHWLKQTSFIQPQYLLLN